eukprot:116496_1
MYDVILKTTQAVKSQFTIQFTIHFSLFIWEELKLLTRLYGAYCEPFCMECIVVRRLQSKLRTKSYPFGTCFDYNPNCKQCLFVVNPNFKQTHIHLVCFDCISNPNCKHNVYLL